MMISSLSMVRVGVMNALKRVAPEPVLLKCTWMRNYSRSSMSLGFEEFYDAPMEKNEVFIAGREWSAADLRRKVRFTAQLFHFSVDFVHFFYFHLFQSFEDLHKLWFILYKERNLLLTAKHEKQKNSYPVTQRDENRYVNVKRSMANIKLVLAERKKIKEFLKQQESNQDITSK